MIKLYGAILSPYVRKTLFVLAKKQLSFELVPQMPFNVDDDFLKISPLGKVPALQDDDLSLADSSVICEYLEDAYPDIATYPIDSKEKAKARWFEEYGDSKVTELATGIFFQRFVAPKMLKQETDEKLVQDIIEHKLPPVLAYLESQVPTQGFLFGDEMLTADIALVSPLINAEIVGYSIDAKQWPQLCAFLERVKSHQVMQPILAAEEKFLHR